jgi:hypothetical protein
LTSAGSVNEATGRYPTPWPTGRNHPLHAPTSPSYFRIVASVSVLALGILTVSYALTLREHLAVSALGVCCLLAIIVPYIGRRRPVDLFEPLNLVLATAAIGIGAKTLYIANVRNELTDQFHLLGKPVGVLIPGLYLLLLAIFALQAGYALGHLIPRRRRSVPNLHPDRWNPRTLAIVCGGLIAASLVSTMLYSVQMGVDFSTPEAVSTKRRLVVEGADYEYAALGYLRWGASLANVAFVLLVAEMATRKGPWKSRLGVAVVLAGLTSAILPIIASSRNQLLLPAIYALIVWHYHGRPLRPRVVVTATLIALGVVMLLGNVRTAHQHDIPLSDQISQVQEPLLGNRNWMDVAKTSHIVDEIDFSDIRGGATMIGWIFAPVPRTVWSEKPAVRPGIELGATVFNRGDRIRTGVPPGLVGELYWNFHIPGVALGMALLGAILRYLYLAHAKHPSRSATILYSVVIVALSLQLPASDVSGVSITILRNVATYGALLLLLRHASR